MSTSPLPHQHNLPHLDAASVRAALPWPALIAALRDAFTLPAIAPRRHVHPLGNPDSPSAAAVAPVLLLMPVWQPDALMGVKLVTVAPDNPKRGLPTVHSLFMLFDAATGAPLAMLDGEELTLRRTAAASALAATWLARADSRTLVVVGTGSLAPVMAQAHAAVRPVDRILVWGRTRDKAEDAVARIRTGLRDDATQRPIEVLAVDDLAQAAAQADIVTCATTSRVPLIHRAWLRPGTHVDLVGGFKPDMREGDDALMAQSRLFVDTRSGALAEAGDLLQPIAAGLLQRESIEAELADLATGKHPGRRDAAEITVFKSVGSAIEDLCAAQLAWRARRDT